MPMPDPRQLDIEHYLRTVVVEPISTMARELAQSVEDDFNMTFEGASASYTGGQ